MVIIMDSSAEHIKKLQNIIKDGGIIKGTHAFCGAPMLTEAMSLCGFDAVWIDMEHTAIGKQEVLTNLIAARSGGAASFVRIPWNDPVLAKPIIDMGTDGIIFPFIRTVEDAKAAVAACTYPPDGVRGYGPLRALEYGRLGKCEYVDTKYRDMLCILQIEHIDIVDHLDELAAMDGVDGFVVGPNDLSGSVGLIGRDTCEEMKPVYDKIGKALKNSGKIFGVSTGTDAAFISEWLERGINLIFSGNDVGYVYSGAESLLSELALLEKNTMEYRGNES